MPGIVPGLVSAEEEHPRLAVEHGLGAVAVVDVPVDDEYPLQPPLLEGVGGRTAMLLNRQKPMPRLRVAWWPGGLTSRNAFCPSPAPGRPPISPAPAAKVAAS